MASENETFDEVLRCMQNDHHSFQYRAGTDEAGRGRSGRRKRGEEVKRTTKIIAVLTVLFAPFALIVFPFFIGWMICDSLIKAVSVPLAKWCEESEVKE